jgi:hypothetical protein
MQLHMAVCYAKPLVSSTVVCSSVVSALIWFKSRGLWTVYWTDYGVCIGLVTVDWRGRSS